MGSSSCVGGCTFSWRIIPQAFSIKALWESWNYQWVEGQPFRLRWIVLWNKKPHCFLDRLTPRPAARDTMENVCLLYTLRWHVA